MKNLHQNLESATMTRKQAKFRRDNPELFEHLSKPAADFDAEKQAKLIRACQIVEKRKRDMKRKKHAIETLESRNYVEIDREFGGNLFFSEYKIQGNSGKIYTVTIECSIDGTPRSEKCTCPAYKFNNECKHIDHVFAAGEIYNDV